MTQDTVVFRGSVWQSQCQRWSSSSSSSLSASSSWSSLQGARVGAAVAVAAAAAVAAVAVAVVAVALSMAEILHQFELMSRLRRPWVPLTKLSLATWHIIINIKHGARGPGDGRCHESASHLGDVGFPPAPDRIPIRGTVLGGLAKCLAWPWMATWPRSFCLVCTDNAQLIPS